jgi:hypothetical protein
MKLLLVIGRRSWLVGDVRREEKEAEKNIFG